MRFDEDTDEIELSTGRRFYAFGNTLGMGSEGVPSYGSDGLIEEDEPFTLAERCEIADEMIARWRLWATTGS